MVLQFRNLDFDATAPMAEWPSEAILTILERGSLSDWRRLKREIDREPWGRLARKVEQALEVSQPYGVSRLMKRAIKQARDRAAEHEREQVAEQVRRYLNESGLTQAEFAERIGTSASRLSTYLNGKVTPSAALLLRMSRIDSGN